MSTEKQGEAIDLSHHLSVIAKARGTSPLKGLQKYMTKPGMLSLAGGMPNANYFPLNSVSGEILAPDSYPLEQEQSSTLSWLWKLFSSKSKEKTTTFTVKKFPDNPDDVNLASSLQYGLARGIPQLSEIIQEFSKKVYKPAYSNFTTLVDCGSTDGISKSILTFCNPGEGVLVSEWTYPSTIAGMLPLNVRPVPVKMDGQGMRSDDLRIVLSEWDESTRGMPRPHVLYTVPVGQNPTGVTVGYTRKKEIYDVCVEFDILIIEDDPYYFLQAGPYESKPVRDESQDISLLSDDEYISRLVPSYLLFDYQGRVVRLDTFSKYMAPGSRLGWFTCNPLFAERLERTAEVSTQNPCGFGQVFVTSILLNWKYDGYVRWLKGLRVQYKQRRDYFIDCLQHEFKLRKTIATEGFREGSVVYEAYLKQENSFINEKASLSGQRVFSFVPPTSGMFVWLQLHLEQHPLFGTLDAPALEMKLWVALAEAGLLLGPGDYFSATSGQNTTSKHGHFRIAFSQAEHEDMKKAVHIIAVVLPKFMKDTTIPA